jgi:hypothetical protein
VASAVLAGLDYAAPAGATVTPGGGMVGCGLLHAVAASANVAAAKRLVLSEALCLITSTHEGVGSCVTER